MTTKNQFLKNDFFSLKRRKNLLTMLLAFAMVGVSIKGMAQGSGDLTAEIIAASTLSYHFANAKKTTDGTDTFYEVDVIFTCSVNASLADQQVYFNFNSLAFGENIYTVGTSGALTSGNLDMNHHPVKANEDDGYHVDLGNVVGGTTTQFYSLELENRQTNQISVAIVQKADRAILEGHERGIAFANVPRKMFRLKIKYENPALDHGISFDVTLSQDQNFVSKITATTEGGLRFPNATFDNSGAKLPIKWTGTTDNDWDTAANWDGGVAPTTTDNIIIPTGLTNYPTISATTGDITISSIALEDGASFIPAGIVTGDATYTRTLPGGGGRGDGLTHANTSGDWYLLSSPFAGQNIQRIAASNSLLVRSLSAVEKTPVFLGGMGLVEPPIGERKQGFGQYNNNATDTNSSWTYVTRNSIRASGSTGDLAPGEGYAIKLATPDDAVVFSGTPNAGDIDLAIAPGSLNNYNLIGNPYMSYVNSNDFAVANTGVLGEETIWIWDSSTVFNTTPNPTPIVPLNDDGAYVAHNSASPLEIAPTQGFFVLSNGTGGNVTFAAANQSHQSTDTFQKTAPRTTFELSVESDSDKASTKVFYIDGKTSGFDNGYDSTLFGGVSYDFTVFTELLADNDGKKLSIQTLPNKDYDKMVVPVGVIASADKEITFSVKSENFPEGIKIYLEDKTNKTMTNLSEGSHKVLLKESQNGVGRFYVHTGTFETPKPVDTNWSIYKSSAKEITISGLQEKANVKVFSILGQEVFNANIADFSNRINLAKLSTGVYIVRLTSTQDTVTKKIILE